MTLNELKPGQFAKIVKLHELGELKRRIIDMGIIPGTKLMMKRIAPFGDPLQINVRGYELSLRKNDAKKIEIVKGE